LASAVFPGERFAQRAPREKSPSPPRLSPENIFTFLHIFLASEENKRILHFANSLRVTG
jgi:hypothetical protein